MSEDRQRADRLEPQEVPFSQLDPDALRQVFQKADFTKPGQRIAREMEWERILRHLSQNEQIVARLYYGDGYSMSEIARQMQCSDQMVHYLHSKLLFTLSSNPELIIDRR